MRGSTCFAISGPTARRAKHALTFIVMVAIALGKTAMAAEPVVVLCADSYCPYNCEPGAKLPGYLIELATAAMATRGETIEYRIEPWARAIVDTRGGLCDALVGTPAGDPADFIFPTLEAGMNINVFLTRADSNWYYNGRDSLAQIVLGGIAGYQYGETVDQWIAEQPEHAGRVQLISGETAISQNLTMLASGRTSAYIEDKMVLQHVTKVSQLGSPWRFAGEASRLPFHIAFSPAKAESAARANALAKTVSQWRKSGQLKKLLAKYHLQDWR